MAKNELVILGSGVATRVEDNGQITVVITPGDLGPSSTGKTILVASSQGNKPIPGTNFMMGLNVYKYAQPKGGKKG